MGDHGDERVLCLRRHVLPGNWIAESVCEPLSWNGFRHGLEGAAGLWMPRSAAECDPSFKQLIPYVVVKRSDTGTIGCYRRRGSEDRLHGLWSVGIGGHINRSDGRGATGNAYEAIQNCVDREISEELGVEPGNMLCRFLGVINEEMTEVGTVHLGLVFEVVLDERRQVSPGDELGCFQWVKAENIDSLELELWSRLALRLFTGF